MRFRGAGFIAILLLASVMIVAALPARAAATWFQTTEEVPPGNPVIGDDRPGDVEPDDDRSYGGWVLLALCLIGAGLLLVKIERWERHRTRD